VGLTGSEPPELVGARILEAAESDQAVADALMFWGSHPLDFYTLFKVGEIIEEHARDEMLEWTSSSEFGRFNTAANSASVSGTAARHAVQRKPPKGKPMSIEEARTYILNLAQKFIMFRVSRS
jgi:hypothetical protein